MSKIGRKTKQKVASSITKKTHKTRKKTKNKRKLQIKGKLLNIEEIKPIKNKHKMKVEWKEQRQCHLRWKRPRSHGKTIFKMINVYVGWNLKKMVSM